MFQHQFHDACDDSYVLESSPKHYEGHFENLAKQSSKDVRKLGSKHKVMSEKLSDKVIGKVLGEEPRQVLDEDQKFQGQAVKDLYLWVVRRNRSAHKVFWTIKVQSNGI